jgi:hypothetical protein
MLKVIWKKCDGAAHTPEGIYQDHCMVCAPYWADYPTCPKCGRKVNKIKVYKCHDCHILLAEADRAYAE